ncbi:MAG: HMA2 domain-containing protein, partial [Ktedonobacteraceae bacterium]
MAVSIAVAEEPRVLHALPGRVRVHVPGWTGQGKRTIEKQLRQVWGVQRVQANPLTSNILVQFDWNITNEQSIIDIVRRIELETVNRLEQERPRPHVLREQSDGTVRARIAVRGLDRDPHVAQRVIAHLEHRPNIRASVNQLTGRILVECKEHEADLEELLGEIADLELPEL